MAAKFPDDIVARIEREFGAGARAGIELVLQPMLESGDAWRVVRCVLVLAAGDIARLRHYVEQATRDYRDVIYWAEYDASGRIADYTQPFGE